MGAVGQVSGQFGQSDEDDDLDVVVTVAEGGLGPDPEVVIAASDDEEGDDEIEVPLDHWSDIAREAATERLRDAGIPFGWDDDELFVYTTDEAAVDELIEAVEHPHELAADEGDAPVGEVDANMLGDLFVIADHLQHDPKDHEQVAKLLLASQEVDEDVPPYGFAKADWRRRTPSGGPPGGPLSGD